MGLALREYQKRVLTFRGNLGEVAFYQNPPIRIEIAKTCTDLSVEPGSVVKGIWSISMTGASHLATSISPGSGGNVVIYAHNKTNLFDPIRWLNIGDEVVVTNANGQIFRYVISDAKMVKPTEIEYVLPKKEETLTLYTCTGFADKDRCIVIAKPPNKS